VEVKAKEAANSHQAGPVDAPPLRTYSSYRAFLNDWYASKKRVRAGFSFRRFSSVLGLKSPNFMQLVLNGQRNISVDLAEKICEVVKLVGAEREYFLALVEFEQAKAEEERLRAEATLLSARKKLVSNQIDRARAAVVSEWYHMLVRELVFLPTFAESGAFVSAALNGLITPAQGEESLRLLCEAGFLVRDQSGKLRAQEIAIDTGDYVFSREAMEKHHGDTLIEWGRNLDRLDPKNQELGLLHIPISSEKLPELRERIRRFQDEIIGWLCEEKCPDRVVQLGTYLLPFAKLDSSNLAPCDLELERARPSTQI
jgi:uncharacterized protein (TIGR02147 family)